MFTKYIYHMTLQKKKKQTNGQEYQSLQTISYINFHIIVCYIDQHILSISSNIHIKLGLTESRHLKAFLTLNNEQTGYG